MQLNDQWVTAMRALDLERAWSISDCALRQRLASQYQKHSGPRHLQHIWQGEPLAGRRVLVRCYHGLGDTIQFARYIKPLRRIARSVTVWCQPELQVLLRQLPDICVLPLHDGTPDVDFDADIEIMELPHALRANRAALAGDVPYFHAVASSDLRNPGALRVGLVWQAGDWDPARAISETQLEALLPLSDCAFYSLRPGANLNSASVTDCSSPSIEVLASRLVWLDVVVTVDTMTAHLAGALGVPTWTLLHGNADWRWGMDSRCVWYPTMRLFRQTTAGDWRGPISEVANELRQLMVRART